MAKAKKLPAPPRCAHCGGEAHLVTGREVYPHRPAYHDRNLWKCTPCDAWVGCHRGGAGDRPLGTPANYELRAARVRLHQDVFDPLWKNAVVSGAYGPESPKAGHIIRSAARNRVYLFLGHHMGLDAKACHIGEFNLEQCRQAWVILRGRTYPEVREWARRDRIEKLLAGRPSAAELKHACLDLCDGCRTSWPIAGGLHTVPSGHALKAEACRAIEVRLALTEKLEEAGIPGAIAEGAAS